MKNKEEVLKNFTKDDLEGVIKVYEALELAYLKDIPMFTKFFCTPKIWSYFVENFNSKSFPVNTDGGFDECDRRIISFNNIYYINYPYVILKITNKSKFNSLSHRDYLGSLMALGIEREKLGDLRVVDNVAYFSVYDDMVDYIVSQLVSVGKSPVDIEIAERADIPPVEYSEEFIIVPSLRIDNIVSKIAKVSRNKALDYIETNKVLINYSKAISKSKDVVEGQRITISGVGKYIVGEIVGSTKSGRHKVKIKKYI